MTQEQRGSDPSSPGDRFERASLREQAGAALALRLPDRGTARDTASRGNHLRDGRRRVGVGVALSVGVGRRSPAHGSLGSVTATLLTLLAFTAATFEYSAPSRAQCCGELHAASPGWTTPREVQARPRAYGNLAGRIPRGGDASGSERRFYGKLGEVIEEQRTVHHDNGHIVTYTTHYRLDRRQRLQQLQYPDGEELAYRYDSGGLVASVTGTRDGVVYPYLARIEHDEFQQQGKHIPGHNNYMAGRSILISDPAELARAAGTGEQVGDVPVGQPGSRERVAYGHVIGIHIDEQGTERDTRVGIIHYSKKGIHVVPAAPEKIHE